MKEIKSVNYQNLVMAKKKKKKKNKKKMKGPNPCWKGYKMIDTKSKNGKKVPNCVPNKKASSDLLKKANQSFEDWANQELQEEHHSDSLEDGVMTFNEWAEDEINEPEHAAMGENFSFENWADEEMNEEEEHMGEEDEDMYEYSGMSEYGDDLHEDNDMNMMNETDFMSDDNENEESMEDMPHGKHMHIEFSIPDNLEDADDTLKYFDLSAENFDMDNYEYPMHNHEFMMDSGEEDEEYDDDFDDEDDDMDMDDFEFDDDMEDDEFEDDDYDDNDYDDEDDAEGMGGDEYYRKMAMSKMAKKSPAWQRSEGKNKEGGLNEKGRKSYNRETGGNLKAPVTEKKPTGKRKKRRKSFCARMKGMKKKLTSKKTAKDPDSRINKALRKWNC